MHILNTVLVISDETIGKFITVNVRNMLLVSLIYTKVPMDDFLCKVKVPWMFFSDILFLTVYNSKRLLCEFIVNWIY